MPLALTPGCGQYLPCHLSAYFIPLPYFLSPSLFDFVLCAGWNIKRGLQRKSFTQLFYRLDLTQTLMLDPMELPHHMVPTRGNAMEKALFPSLAVYFGYKAACLVNMTVVPSNRTNGNQWLSLCGVVTDVRDVFLPTPMACPGLCLM